MKTIKWFAGILISLTLILGMTSVFAEETAKSIPYGRASAELTLVDKLTDDMESVPGSFNLGTGTFTEDGFLIESSSNMYDLYRLTTGACPIKTGSAEYLVFSMENRSDGDVYFCFQPYYQGENRFLSSYIAEEYPALLVDEKGVSQVASWSESRAVNGRDGILVPMDFQGYLFVPVRLIAGLDSLTESLITENGELEAEGFHLAPDDASYLEMLIKGIYLAGALPAYEEPEKETAKPTDEPTAEPTAEPTNVPEPTDAPETQKPTDAPDNKDNGKKKGCGSVMSFSAVGCIGLSACVFFLKKKENK